MKSVKTLVFAALLVFSLAFNTFAGDVDVPGAPAPPPPRLTTTTYEDPLKPSTDTQETGNATSESSDYLFYEALAALLSVY
jgi:hypothetical protein